MAGHGSANFITPSMLKAEKPNRNKPVIDAVQTALTQIGVKAEYFTETSYLKAGFNEATFASHLRPFHGISDLSKLEQIMYIGVRKGFFQAIRSIRYAPTFMQFLTFLRSPAGQAELINLEKFSAIEMGALTVYEAQRADMINGCNAIKAKYQVEIEDLLQQIHNIKKTCNAEEAKHKLSFVPAGIYEPLDMVSVVRASWDMFCEEADMGYGSPPATDQNLDEAYDSFSDTVRQAHLVQFLTKPENKGALDKFLDTCILRFDRDSKPREATHFRGLKAILGGEQPLAYARAKRKTRSGLEVEGYATGKK